MIEKLQKAKNVRSQIVKQINKNLLEQYKTIDYIPKDLTKRGGSGYSKTVIEVIKSFIIGDNKIHYIVTKNNGSISELPYNSYVECPCAVSKNKVSPLACGKLPLAAAAVIVPMKIYETLLIKAAMKRDKDLLYQAMMAHPLLSDHVLVSELMKEILMKNKNYLPIEFRSNK